MTTEQTLCWLGLVFAGLILAFMAGRISAMED